ncbi:Neurotransmitter-gated ion-channel transmembrane region [Ancylostoma ceylanicum]|uniref:Neurotransmitter-gated ion-channel transmembrane region n=1 Tax=Ancylostoma ceylanicum TaxID=53326 RepID=A0A0D6M0Y6_9BILA|nr:Neurotransmitter-gated ion-channel transmembrane region [Ancylostoma ceylanicum]
MTDFQVDIYFQEKWIDPRLMHNNTKRILLKDPHLFKLIWHPDIYFANARTAEFHDVTQPNFLVWIYPNGTVWYDYAYDSDEIIIKWNGESPVDVNPEIRMPDMRLRTISHTIRNDTYATGIWSCALAEFHVDREIMHHIIQSYLPTALIVVISWFSFWLDVEAVPGRVSLSITTLLTLATQSSAARMALPQASYVKAIDVWMGACMTFVFSAMIEFTVVNYCTRRKPRKHEKSTKGLSEQVHSLVAQYKEKKAYQNGTCYEVSLCENENSQQNLEKKQLREMNQPSILMRQNFLSSTKRKAIEERMNRVEENRKYAQLIDRRSRVYFPLAFIIFNISYWVYYIKYAVDTIE